MTPKCTYKDLIQANHTIEYLCKTGVKICTEKQDLFNFFSLYWCDFNGNSLILCVFYLLAIFLIFKYTSITVDEYIAEGITKLSDFLNFSEALSAVTLLAFANGAGDFITALVASGSEGGISYNIGALFGAGMFVCSVVVAICIFQSEDGIDYDKMIIFRDIGIYLVATVVTIGIAFYGKITWWTSVILLLIYLMLIIVVLVEERYFTEQTKGEGDEDMESLVGLGDEGIKKEKGKMVNLIASNNFQNYKKKLKNEGALETKKKNNSGIYESAFGKDSASLSRFLSAVRQLKYGVYLRKKTEMIAEHRNLPYSEKSYLDLIIETTEIPFFFILYLTALPTNEEHYSKLRCLVYSIPGMVFMWFICHPELDETYIHVALPAGGTLFLIFAYTLPDDGKPPKWFIVICLMGVVSGLMWTYLLIGGLIDMLELLGVVLNLPETYLGLTILAIGNALPDALTTISLCKEGAGVMAISGGYAGQLFGYLVGFGVSMLKVTLKKGAQEFDLFQVKKLKENLLDLAVIGTIFVILLYTFFHGILNGYKMNKVFAWNLVIIYGGFLIFSTYVAVKSSYEV